MTVIGAEDSEVFEEVAQDFGVFQLGGVEAVDVVAHGLILP